MTNLYWLGVATLLLFMRTFPCRIKVLTVSHTRGDEPLRRERCIKQQDFCPPNGGFIFILKDLISLKLRMERFQGNHFPLVF